MRKLTLFRVLGLVAPILALASAGITPALDETPIAGLGDSPGSCSACGAPHWIFIDGVETAATCRWDSTAGGSEVCGSTCGDCSITLDEACDDGNSDEETQCPYGTPQCFGCSATCDQVLSLVGGFCGDSIEDFDNEECDDGNSVTESACPYGEESCNVCASDCTEVAGTGALCGDGAVDLPYEVCDDNNTSACGLCSANCRAAIAGTSATGVIATVQGNELVDGETLTFDDGFHNPLTFEFDKNFACNTPGCLQLTVSDGMNEGQVAAAIANLLNFFSGANVISISASAIGGGAVLLTHGLETSTGNVAQSETVSDPGFFIVGLSGGTGGNCGITVGCTQDGDCAQGFECIGGICA